MLKPEKKNIKKQDVKTVNLYPFPFFRFYLGKMFKPSYKFEISELKNFCYFLQIYNFCQF